MTHLHRVRREHMLVMFVTLGLTVFADPVNAVVLGLVAAGMTQRPAVRASGVGQRDLGAAAGRELPGRSTLAKGHDQFSARRPCGAPRNIHGGVIKQVDREPRSRCLNLDSPVR